MKEIELPLQLPAVRLLTVGEQVLLSGKIFTAREEAQKYLYSGGALPFETVGTVMYHCGPIGRKSGKKWVVNAAGPDASSPLEGHLGDILGRLRLRGIIGRGSVGPKTLAACQRYGACYFHTIGGAALSLARCIKEVKGVHLTDRLTGPEAVWELEVEGFPAVITVDSHGRSLHDLVHDVSHRRFLALTD